MAVDKRKPPGGRGGLSGNSVVTANFDISRDNPAGSKKQVECASSGLRPFGKIAAGIATDLRFRRQGQAAQAESDEEREAALEIAGEIARLAGLETDPIGQEAA